MVRFLFRVLASLTLAGALILALLDATRSVAASALVVTPLLDSWEAASPGSLAAVHDFITARLGAFAWDTVATSILSLPGFVVLGLLAFVFYAIGYKPNRYRTEWGR